MRSRDGSRLEGCAERKVPGVALYVADENEGDTGLRYPRMVRIWSTVGGPSITSRSNSSGPLCSSSTNKFELSFTPFCEFELILGELPPLLVLLLVTLLLEVNFGTVIKAPRRSLSAR